MQQMNLLKALARDCRDHGELDVADGIDKLATDIAELCEAVKAERGANDSGDTIAYINNENVPQWNDGAPDNWDADTRVKFDLLTEAERRVTRKVTQVMIT